QRRQPRIAIVGSEDVSMHQVLRALGASDDLEDVRAKLGAGRWYDYEFDSGLLSLADLRGREQFQALDYHAPDAIVAVAPSGLEDVGSVVEALQQALEEAEDRHAVYPVGLVVVCRTDGLRHTADFRSLQAF